MSESKPDLSNMFKGFGNLESATPLKSENTALETVATSSMRAFSLEGITTENADTLETAPAVKNTPSSFKIKTEPEEGSIGRNLFGAGASGTYSTSKPFKPSVTFKKQFAQFASKHETKPAPVKEETEQVNLEGPTVVSTPSSTKSGSVRPSALKYPLFCIPVQGLDSDYCLSYKRQGSSFCLKQGCSMNHSGAGKAEVKPNHGYVLKTNTKNKAATDTPEINLNNMDQTFLLEIMNAEKTLEEWMELATSMETADEASFSQNDLDKSRNTAKKFKTWHTPMLKKAQQHDTEFKMETLTVLRYSAVMPYDMSQIDEAEFFENVLKYDGAIARITHFLDDFQDLFKSDHKELHDLGAAFTMKFGELSTMVGKRPQFTDSSFDVATLWEGYTTCIQMFRSTLKYVKDEFDEWHKKSEETTLSHIRSTATDLEGKLNLLKADLMTYASLESRVHTLENDISKPMNVTALEKRLAFLEKDSTHFQSTWIPQVEKMVSDLLSKSENLNQRTLVQESFSSQAVQHVQNHNKRIGDLEAELLRVKSLMQGQHSSSNLTYNPFGGNTSGYSSFSAQASKPSWSGGFTTGSTQSTSAPSQPAWTGGFGSVPSQSQSSVSQEIIQRLIKLEASVAGLKSEKEVRIIKFAGLNLRNLHEVHAWLDTHYPGPDFGVIIDFHAAMEHIIEQLTSSDILKHMHDAYRLNIQDLNEAYIVQSFEREIPRFFKAEAKHKAVDITSSHLPSVPSWEEWDKPEDGFKAMLQKECTAFCNAFRNTLIDKLQTDFPIMYNIATQCLSATENFIQLQISFAEEMFKLYSQAKYSPEHAWHIVTMLWKSIILKVFGPRKGVISRFRKNDMRSVKAQVFYCCMLCIDIMEELRLVQLENDNNAAMDLIRFVSRNPESYKITNLEEKNTTLEKEVKDLKRKFDELAKKFTNVTGDEKWKKPLNDLKGEIGNHKKKIAALEKKVE